MAEAKFNIHVQDLVKRVTMTVRITGVRRFAARTKAGLWLIRLGARVIGMGIEVSLPASPSSENPAPPEPPPDREQLIGG